MSAQGRSTTDDSAFVLDGATIAEGVLAKVAEEARALSAHGVTPGLAVVLVGDNPASQTYIARQGQGGQGVRLSFDPAHSASRDERGRIAHAGRGAQR